jgi:thiosulfate/3-mercaptopyruvate sulfurtransferase
MFHADCRTFYNLEKIRNLWTEWGLELPSDDRVFFYCGSGWRSAMGWCLARVIGHNNCANYDGGFLEWTMLDQSAVENPIEEGAGSLHPLLCIWEDTQ